MVREDRIKARHPRIDRSKGQSEPNLISTRDGLLQPGYGEHRSRLTRWNGLSRKTITHTM